VPLVGIRAGQLIPVTLRMTGRSGQTGKLSTPTVMFAIGIFRLRIFQHLAGYDKGDSQNSLLHQQKTERKRPNLSRWLF